MQRFWNGRKMLGVAFVGCAGLAAAMMMAKPPARPELSSGAANAAEAPAETDVGTVQKASLEAKPVAPKPVDDTFVIKRILPIDGPIKYGEWHWDETNVPDGPIVITVDLDARVCHAYQWAVG